MTLPFALSEDNFEPSVEPSPALGLEPASVLVRTLVLPTTSLKRAAQAVRLQLDRLSPAPESEILYDLAMVGEGADGGGATWAVAFARRTAVARACAALERPSVAVEKTVAGREVTFRFRDPSGGFVGRPAWAPWAAPAAAIGFAVAVLLGAIDISIREELTSLRADGGAKATADRAWREASDRDVAVRSWLASSRDSADAMVLCAMGVVVEATAGRHALVSLDGGPGLATLTFAGPVGERLAARPGVSVTADTAAPNRKTARFASTACSEATP